MYFQRWHVSARDHTLPIFCIQWQQYISSLLYAFDPKRGFYSHIANRNETNTHVGSDGQEPARLLGTLSPSSSNVVRPDIFLSIYMLYSSNTCIYVLLKVLLCVNVRCMYTNKVVKLTCRNWDYLLHAALQSNVLLPIPPLRLIKGIESVVLGLLYKHNSNNSTFTAKHLETP